MATETKKKTTSHKSLSSAKKAKNDEFYTQLSDIENELKHYKDHFKDKVVFCNCDDPEESNFWFFFRRKFEDYGLKKLISTHYVENGSSYALITYSKNGTIQKIKLEGNGDFRSEECKKYLEEADIVCTNPPFSLFREYVAQLMEYDKKFLIIGNQNAITYKEIFPLIKDNKLWLGMNPVKEFKKPDGTIQKFGNICWFTNLTNNKRNEELILFRRYSDDPSKYPKYDNYDAINVDKVADIPCDYNGVMGVPITFLDKYNPNQFEIVGSSGTFELTRELGVSDINKDFIDTYVKQGGARVMTEHTALLCYYDKDGNAIVPYARILIRRKKSE